MAFKEAIRFDSDVNFRLFIIVASALVLCAQPALAKTRKPAKKPIADQITTSAIDIAKNVIERRLNQIPPAGTIEIAFAPYPQRSAQRLVEKIIDASQVSVTIAAYQMTSKPIADALCRAAGRGVAVTAVLDAKSNPHGHPNSKRDYLADCGVAVRGDSRYPIMHDKFIVVDDKHVETGSFNYSFAAAERNAENAMVIWDNPKLAAKYAQEFDRLFAEAQD
jgi:phosphatidylserine/phosphatidylglycerophosphate/cardiolipin synthase-like enzyme